MIDKKEIGVKIRIRKINSYLLENSNKTNIKGLLVKLEEMLQEYKFEKG